MLVDLRAHSFYERRPGWSLFELSGPVPNKGLILGQTLFYYRGIHFLAHNDIRTVIDPFVLKLKRIAEVILFQFHPTVFKKFACAHNRWPIQVRLRCSVFALAELRLVCDFRHKLGVGTFALV